MFADVVVLALGLRITVLVKRDGSVWSTGRKSDPLHFTRVLSRGATAAAAGSDYSIVISQDGSVSTTSTNSEGQISDWDLTASMRTFSGISHWDVTASMRTFSVVQKIPQAKAVAAGSYHSLVLTQQGHVWATGANKYGQLGAGSKADKTTFARVMQHGVAIAAGS